MKNRRQIERRKSWRVCTQSTAYLSQWKQEYHQSLTSKDLRSHLSLMLSLMHQASAIATTMISTSHPKTIIMTEISTKKTSWKLSIYQRRLKTSPRSRPFVQTVRPKAWLMSQWASAMQPTWSVWSFSSFVCGAAAGCLSAWVRNDISCWETVSIDASSVISWSLIRGEDEIRYSYTWEVGGEKSDD